MGRTANKGMHPDGRGTGPDERLGSLADSKAAGFGIIQLSELVALHLREQIIAGRLKKGEFLRIQSIAEELAVSTTPVREGLLLLQTESFVSLIPRRGFVVNGLSLGDLRDLLWVQATVGAELAARAAHRMTNAELARLIAVDVAYQQAVVSGDEEKASRLGHAFHREVNVAARSPRLTLLLRSLSRLLPRRFYAGIDGAVKDALEHHPLILKAIQAKNPEAARSHMHRHLSAGAQSLIDALQRRGILIADESRSAALAHAADAPERRRKRAPRARGAR